jgi:GTP cyclohydrolase II
MRINISTTQSLNGVYCKENGESLQLSSTEHQKWVHQMRNIHDAILVFGNTLLNDNPNLSVRLSESQQIYNSIIKQSVNHGIKYCIIIDKTLKTLDNPNFLELNIFKNTKYQFIFIHNSDYHDKIIMPNLSYRITYIDYNTLKLPYITLEYLKYCLKLFDDKISSVWCEMGHRSLYRFLNDSNDRKEINKLYLTIVPQLQAQQSQHAHPLPLLKINLTEYIEDIIPVAGTFENIYQISFNKLSTLQNNKLTTIMTKYGKYDFYMFRDTVVLVKFSTQTRKYLLRVHSECTTSEIFNSLLCDCKDQLDKSMELIENNDKGIIIYLKQEGRGIGLYNKLNCYDCQQQQHSDAKNNKNTYEANLECGNPIDARSYTICKTIVEQLNVDINDCILLTNNKQKIEEITDDYLDVKGIKNKFNQNYLDAKFKIQNTIKMK